MNTFEGCFSRERRMLHGGQRLTAAIRYGPPLRCGHTRLAAGLAELRPAGSDPQG
jgi:hypothetical protein